MHALPLPLACPPTSQKIATGVLEVNLDGEAMVLHAERGVHWPRERTLFVADIHLGKGAAFRAGGVPLPRGSTSADLARLTALVERTAAARLVVLGDFLHAKSGRVAALGDAFVEWRRRHAVLDLLLVRGNHDAHAGDPPGGWDVRCVDDPFALPPFLACHRVAAPRTGYALCGHVHPGVRIQGAGRESARLPCFVVGPRHMILPAFGRFTGMAEVARGTGERIVVVAGRELFTLPEHASDVTLS